MADPVEGQRSVPPGADRDPYGCGPVAKATGYRRPDGRARPGDRRARGAIWLDSRYDLACAHLLCIGDHDLTALLVTLVNPAVQVTVVDLDERILEYLDTVASERSRPVRCLAGDLRFGLPGPARDWA